MSSQFDYNCDENLFHESFFKSLLSFMNDDDDSSCSSGYASEVFSVDHVVTSGFLGSTLGSTQRCSDSIYKESNFGNKLYTSWTTSSAGLTLSSQESPKISLNENYQDIPTLKSTTQRDFLYQEYQDLTVKHKNLTFAKFLRNSFLTEFQNHPARPRQIRGEFVMSEHQVKPKLRALSCMPTTSTACQISDQNKENFSINAQKSLKICKFCFKNGEPSVVYMGHFLRTSGIVTCPILRRYTCDICGATGGKSHTRKYCPMNKEPMDMAPHFRKLTNGVLTCSVNHK